MDADSARDIEIFNNIKNYIRRKINNCDNNFSGSIYKPERDEVYELVRRSVETRESNSAILCGAPGCGKTALVNNVLKELHDNGTLTRENSVVVRLNGLIHTDDGLTLQDIARQMKTANISEETRASKSFQENLARILNELKTNSETLPCIVFILDEFHLFAEHKNQLLLYNLFDTAQSAQAPICVLGLTYYSDVMDLLEKRVLSRFSHRVIQMAKTVTVEDRLAITKEIFTLTSEDLPNVDEIYKFVWNSRTDELVEDKSVRRAVLLQLDLDPGQTRFRNLLFKLFNYITFQEPLLNAQSLIEVFALKDALSSILSRLSAMEIALVIAVKKHTTLYEREPFNFEMILTQYLKLVKQHASTLVMERAVVLKAFQRLQELEIVVPLKRGASNATGRVPLEYQLYNFALTDDQVSEGVNLNKCLSTDLAQWASKVETA